MVKLIEVQNAVENEFKFNIIVILKNTEIKGMI